MCTRHTPLPPLPAESFLQIATGKLVVLSEQQLVDCVENPNQVSSGDP